ncbi:hypothetical protein HD806DRAFT_508154 [Xylariaceae sp. AK1471]|nr:hypothetical protein HD806DRAFT_508154 [Xylariaceae sp. AK1471]
MQNTGRPVNGRRPSPYDHPQRNLGTYKPKPNRRYVAQQEGMKVEFRSDDFMQGPPNHTAEDFKKPRLRKCPLRLDTVKWRSATKLGNGADGCAWKVAFGKEGTFVLKVFWDLQAPQISNGYFAPQRECQNAAILQMIEAVLEEGPVHLPFEYPDKQEQAMANILAFSVPRENMEQRPEVRSPRAVLSRSPSLRRCYGWLDFDYNFDLIKRMPPEIRPAPRKTDKPPRSMTPGNTYHAIVYEYIPEDENEPESIKALLRFFLPHRLLLHVLT